MHNVKIHPIKKVCDEKLELYVCIGTADGIQNDALRITLTSASTNTGGLSRLPGLLNQHTHSPFFGVSAFARMH